MQDDPRGVGCRMTLEEWGGVQQDPRGVGCSMILGEWGAA